VARKPSAALLRIFGVPVLSALLMQSGCMSAISLKQAVQGYNTATTDILAEQLLANIVRVGQRQTAHFTGVTSIAATFNYTVNAGATPALTGDSGGMILPTFGGSASDNPTFSIVPIEGEDFSKRLLNPMDEGKLTLLLRQYTDIDLALRLMAGEVRIEEQGQERSYRNRPSHAAGYPLFRRIVLHLSSIQDRNHLYVEPLTFVREWTLPVESVTAEGFQALEHEYEVSYDANAKTYRLQKQEEGRLMITNYDPDALTNEERLRLNDVIEHNAPNEIAIDIRAGFPGGEFPIAGKFRLRSFMNVLAFVGRDLTDEPEYHVAPDPRTPPVRDNPPHTLELMSSALPILDAEQTAYLNGRHYALKPDTGYPWNRAAFQLLTTLYQMTVVDLPRFNTPAITIAK